MKPVDVRRKEFKSKWFGGYNANQVDDFLDTVADNYEDVYTENLRMSEELSSLRERLEQFDKLEDSIQSALVNAERAAEDLRKSAGRDTENARMNANREAELTIREAKARAHQLLADSSERAERVRESYEALTEAKKYFASDFRKLLKSYLDVMDNVEVASAKKIEASLRERLDLESLSIAREAAANEPVENGDSNGEATRAMDRKAEASEADAVEKEDPEVEEPEVEPSSTEHAPAENASTETDPKAATEVDREESGPDGESGDESSGPSENEYKDRSWRASRFLRRRE
ncbi:MAG: DivIVA domain-containing protein [Rubrobacteraceae bacterium]